MEKVGAVLNAQGNIELGLITIDPVKKELSFPTTLCNWNSEELEALICTASGRAHEALLVTDVDPYKLQLALILLGATNGGRLAGGSLDQGSLINIDIQSTHKKDQPRLPIEAWLYNYQTNAQMKRMGWVFVGSSFDKGLCLASAEGNLVNLWSQGNTILDNPEPTGNLDNFIRVYGPKLPNYHFDVDKVTYELWKLPITVFMTLK